jgi:ParB family transcriptional regulator, chromosome partitioning protein
MATKKTGVSAEFLYVPTSNITVLEQVRSNVNIESDSFKSLMQSINDRGIIEPLIVTAQEDGKYTLICGGRRYQAAKQLKLETVPVRVIETGKESGEAIAYQLTENLQREDLNPIDQAKEIFAYIQIKHPDKGYNLDGVMGVLVSYNRKPESLPKEVATTVVAIAKITVKSITTLYSSLSLLKLVPKIQDVIAAGTLPVSQGYLFAANLGSPDFFTIFDEIMEKSVTNAKLEKMLTAYKKARPKPAYQKPMPMKKKVAVLQNAKSYFDKKTGMYAKSDLRTFLDELKVLTSFIEKQIETAPETVIINKPGNKPMPQV